MELSFRVTMREEMEKELNTWHNMMTHLIRNFNKNLEK